MTRTNKVALYAIARKTWKSHAVRVGALTGLGLLMTELWFWIFRRDELFRNFFFESTSSDQMMQTLDLDVLIDHPIRNFWYLHFQPPGFDLLRLILALPEAIFGSQPTSENLDLRIYLVHILMFGVMNAIIFYWARIISHSFVLALTASLVWAAYPGNIAMVTFLDSMYLSSFLVLVCTHLWFMYLRTRHLSLALAACLAGIALTLTRTSLQPILFVGITVLAYFVVRQATDTHMRKRLSGWLLVCILLTIATPIKQFALFGTFSSTSSSGHHLLGAIRYLPTEQELAEIDVPSRVTRNAEELVNDHNVPEEVIANYKYSQLFFDRIAKEPVLSFRESLVSAQRSIIRGAAATQTHQRNVLVESMPGSSVSAGLFSGLSYVLIVGIGVVVLLILRLRGAPKSPRGLLFELTPLITLLVVLTTTILLGSLRYTDSPEMGAPYGWTDGFTWTESIRLKFLLEVVFMPAAIVGWFSAVQSLYRRLFQHSRSIH